VTIPDLPIPRQRLLALALASVLAGCSTDGLFSGDKIDYRAGAAKTKPLEVPPDLTQLSRDARYAPQGGIVSAAAAQAPATSTRAAVTSAVALPAVGKVRVERQGQQRWLVVEGSNPEALWPEIKNFWLERGFALTLDNAQAGVMETDWAENRSKLPQDLIRSTLGRIVDKLYDTGERDRFRTRLERGPAGTEIYISHRGLEEVFSGTTREHTVWVPRASDPGLEVEMLTRLMVRLGSSDEAARTTVAAAPEALARARITGDGSRASLEVDEPFDRAWRRIGLALDRSGFTVEDRDRNAGIYFVRYIDPKLAAQEEPGFFARLFGAKAIDKTPVRYRVTVKGDGAKTQVTVLGASGSPETGDTGKSIVASLVRELR